MNIKNWFKNWFKNSAPTITEENICFGNWHDKNAWSQEARSSALLSSKASDDIVLHQLRPVAKRILQFFPGYHIDRVAKFANSIVYDLYRCGVLPCEERKRLMDNPTVWHDLTRLLLDFGELSVVLPDERIVPEDSIIINSQRSDIFLVMSGVGIPVKEFLFWYKNFYAKLGFKMVLSEWSGIPKAQLARVYDEILEIFRNQIEHEYRRERKIPNTEEV